MTKRNVRARLIHRMQSASQSHCTPILKRQRYTASSQPLIPLQPKENIVESSEGPLKDAIPECKRRIRFYNKVTVVHIPSRFHYPELMRKSLWGTLKEITENARRNTIEFASEGWDWRAATEDEAMYVAPNGERIHPVHVRQAYLRKQL